MVDLGLFKDASLRAGDKAAMPRLLRQAAPGQSDLHWLLPLRLQPSLRQPLELGGAQDLKLSHCQAAWHCGLLNELGQLSS